MNIKNSVYLCFVADPKVAIQARYILVLVSKDFFLLTTTTTAWEQVAN